MLGKKDISKTASWLTKTYCNVSERSM